MTTNLSPDELARLFDATRATLNDWIERLRAETGAGFPEKVTAFRPEMKVHGRYNSRVPTAARPCSGSSTPRTRPTTARAARPAANCWPIGALSRLLHGDWPKSIDEL
jgi:formamidopyrimidine-DNA glycosylase